MDNFFKGVGMLTIAGIALLIVGLVVLKIIFAHVALFVGLLVVGFFVLAFIVGG